MKFRTLLCGVLLLFALNSCKTQKQSQSEYSHVKVNDESATRTLKGRALSQKIRNSQVDTSTTDEQKNYEIETAISQTPVFDNTGKQIGTNTNTVIKEKGQTTKKKTQRRKQTTKGNKVVKENEDSTGKKSTGIDSTSRSEQTTKTTTGGSGIWPKLFIALFLLLGISIYINVVLIKRKAKEKLKEVILPLLCIAMFFFAGCGQRVEAPAAIAMEVKQTEPIKVTLLDIAQKEVGKKEIPKGSNWGGDIPKYLNSVGITYPAPWCMSFCYWVAQEYCDDYNLKHPSKTPLKNPLYKTGHVLTQWRKCILLRIKPEDVQPGDMFIILYLDKKGRPSGSGHCGWVKAKRGDNIYTIEGNSNKNGSSEGWEVCEHKRPIKEVYGFIRLFKE